MNAQDNDAGRQTDNTGDDDPGSTRTGRATVALTDDTGRLEDATELARLVQAAIDHLSLTGELRVKVIDDEAMASAHLEYLDTPDTTDVITFDLSGGETEHTRALDADLLLCLDEARRQSDARGHKQLHELLLYAVHGVMHCLGHDDHDDESFERMHATEDELLTAIGIGAVFARDEQTPPSENAS
ncbi:MAG: rRNA maturation RNase YbeY [Planctomycetota bacterium]